MRFALTRAGIPIRRIGTRATRVRLGGAQVRENFDHPLETRIKQALGPAFAGLALQTPLRAGWHALRRREADLPRLRDDPTDGR